MCNMCYLRVYHIHYALQSRCPVMQFYAFGCEKLGSMVATLATGSRMNNKKAHGRNQPQHGLLTWLEHLTAPWKRWVMKSFYGNETESIEKVRETSPDFANVHFPADHSLIDISKISARAFLVCSLLQLVGPHIQLTECYKHTSARDQRSTYALFCPGNYFGVTLTILTSNIHSAPLNLAVCQLPCFN